MPLRQNPTDWGFFEGIETGLFRNHIVVVAVI